MIKTKMSFSIAVQNCQEGNGNQCREIDNPSCRTQVLKKLDGAIKMHKLSELFVFVAKFP